MSDIAADFLPTIDESLWSDRTLANGMRAIVLSDASSANVAISVGYHVGGKNDPHGRSGFAHLFEHLMFKGTKQTPAETIDRLTEDVGGYNNAYTTPDLTVYYEVVPANYLETMLWAEADRLGGLVVDEANFATERDVVISEYDQRILADPYGKLDEFIERQMFSGHAYEQGVIGDPDSLRASSLADVIRFHETFYRPDNAVLAVVGDLDVAQANEWIERYFGAVRRPANAIPRPDIVIPARTADRLTYSAANVPLTAVSYSFPLGPVTSPDSPIVDLLEFILGAGRSSRMYRTLVHQTQIASQVSVESDMREHGGLFQVRVLLHRDEDRQAAEKIIRAELAKIIAEPVTADELDRARNQLATLLVRHSESANNRSLAFVSGALLRNDPRSIESDGRAYQAATIADLSRVARDIFSAEPSVYEYRTNA